MKDYAPFAEDMCRQALATLHAGEPELARSVLNEVIAEARSQQDAPPLHELTARIGCGVITELLSSRKADDAAQVWASVLGIIGIPRDEPTRIQASRCAGAMLLGSLALGRLKQARTCYANLVHWAGNFTPCLELDRTLAQSGFRLISASLPLHHPSKAYEHYIPIRSASERFPMNVDITLSRARSALVLTAGFARCGDPDFARTLAREVRMIFAQSPSHPELARTVNELHRIFPN